MITVDKISKYYGPLAAISEVSFTAEPGEVVGLLGLNGAGKTTTLRILSGLLVPTSGRVEIAGVDMALAPEEARAKIGFLPETPPLYPDMTVDAYLRFVARINGVTGDAQAAVAQAVEATDLVPKRHQRIGTLSHGYQRRVGVAHAIVHEPKLILLDEPTGALDPVQIVHVRELIRSLRENRTIIVSSHILSEVRQMCDRIIVLHRGQKVAEGTPAELGTQPQLALDLEVRGTRDALENALGRVAAVTQHQILGEAEGIVEASVQLSHDCREELVATLVGAELGVRRLGRADSGLEEVFLKLTQSGGPNGAAPDANSGEDHA